MIRIALRYFLVVFAAGFVLGTVRTLWLEPNLGERSAELLELPLMILVSWLAARHVVRRPGTPAGRRDRLLIGLLALALLLAMEFLVVVPLTGQQLTAYLQHRDPVAGSAYAISLVVFGVLPALVRAPARDPS
ncbi:MAG: hypothetical protein R3233_02970 [Xanthomonadales bacterium]|nr:hypothetical protein [Xanthomonadales bacterium]